MTEDQAKTRWCPFYRVATSGGDQSTYEMDNRPPHYDQSGDAKNPVYTRNGIRAEACCIGSACMAWRWNVVPVAAAKASERVGNIRTPDDPLGQRTEGVIKTPARAAVAGHGYCGLAGPLTLAMERRL